MSTRSNKLQEKRSDSKSVANAVGNSKSTGAFQLQNNRPESTTQKQIQRMASGGAIQLKKETDLKAGTLNMIGETHSDYKGEEARRYEAQQIDKTLNGYQYLMENQLKVNETDKDFADPIDLRLEQIIAFYKEGAQRVIPMLKGIEQGKLAAGAHKLTSEKQAEQLKLEQTDVGAIVSQFIGDIVSDEFNAETVIAKLNLGGDRYTSEMAEKLSEEETWKPEVHDPDDKYSDNFEAVTSAFNKEYMRVWREEEMQKFKAEQESAEVALPDEDKEEVISAKNKIWNLVAFYNDFKGRLPSTLKLYYDMKKSGNYNDVPHFKFALKMVPVALEKWNEFDAQAKAIQAALTSDEMVKLAGLITLNTQAIEAVFASLDGGLVGGMDAVESVGPREKRSKAMHTAANKLKGQTIAWKVGDLHIQDIERLEQAGTIPKADYSYILQSDFFPKHINTDDMASYKGSREDVGEGYHNAEAEVKKRIESADKKLAERLPWEDQMDSIEHLNIGNLITNQTGLIADAVQNGVLLKLKSLTIHHLSITPELVGRFKSLGVTVNLTGV